MTQSDPLPPEPESTPQGLAPETPPVSEQTLPYQPDNRPSRWKHGLRLVLGPTFLAILGIVVGLLGAGCGNFVCQLPGANQGLCGYCHTSAATPIPIDEASVTSSPAATDTAIALISTLARTPPPLASLMVIQATLQPSVTASITSVSTSTAEAVPLTTSTIGEAINSQLNRAGLPQVETQSALMTLAQAYADNIGQLPQDKLEERVNRGTLTLFNGEIELGAKAHQFGYDKPVSIIIIPQQSEIILSDLEARLTTDVSLTESGILAYGFSLYQSPLTRDQTAVLVLGTD